jgi:S1-C subfamily serine protease
MEQYDERTWFCPRTGDQVSLTYIDLVPDLPAPLDDLPLLRHRLAIETAEVGALIEAHIVMIDSVPALYQLLKLPIPDQDSGQAFIAAFTVPKASCSAVLRIQCAEGEPAGLRESAVISRVGPEAFVRPHPYAPTLEGRLPWHAGDEERWDGQFPDHPLSRAREWANRTISTAQIDPLPGGSSVADVATAVLPSVALVEVSTGQGQGSGSAVVYSADGVLITNNHVVEDAQEVTVVTADSERLQAEVVATDPASDLAVLRVETEQELPVIRFAEEPPKVGETAIAVGSPFGLESTVTTGIVSATERVVPAPDAPLVGMLQTDAAINPGNSGGALVNDRGELIGINTAILSETGANNGIGFAIPVSTVLAVTEQLLETGEVSYAQLGVIGASVTPSIAERFGLEASEGAIIDEVAEGSAADEAGVQPDDIVVALGDERITSMDDLFAAVRQLQPGDETVIVVIRDGEELTLPVTLGEAPPQD